MPHNRSYGFPPRSCTCLSCAFWPQNHAHRTNENDEIEKETSVLQIEEVIRELVFGIVERSAVGIMDLSPTGDARLHRMTLDIIGDVLRQPLDEIGSFGPGSDKAHVAAQHIIELRELIDAQLSDDPADACDSGIALGCPERCAVALGV